MLMRMAMDIWQTKIVMIPIPKSMPALLNGDGLDNNCDGSVDEGVAKHSLWMRMAMDMATQIIPWNLVNLWKVM